MLANPTVLVLGAGSSADLDFPTGRVLTHKIIRAIAKRNTALYDTLQRLEYPTSLVEELGNALKASSVSSVDAFLEHNPRLVEVGKAALAFMLIPHEQPARLLPDRDKMSWREYLWGRILPAGGESLADVPISFVTFNYDRSLEQFLIQSAASTFDITLADATELVGELKMVHVYGKLGDLPGQRPTSGIQRDYNPKASWDEVAAVANAIKILPEGIDSSAELKDARNLLSEARVVCFLGFGYHETNIGRLDVANTISAKVFGSACGIGAGQREEVEGLVPGIRLYTGTALESLRELPVFAR